AQQSLTIVVNTPGTPPQISTAPLTLAVIGQPFSLNLAATGGTPPYTWSLIGPGPDPALQLSSAGVISGTPTLPNDCPSGPGLWTNVAPPVFFQVLVTDKAGQSNVRQVCLPSYFPDPQITGLTPPNVTVDGQTHVITVNGANFRNNAVVTIGGSVSTTFVSNSAITFTLIPAIGGAFGLSGGGLLGEGAISLVVVQPYGHTTPPANLFIFDPAPTVTSVSAVLNNSTNPCTTNLNCQLVINGSRLVFATTYKIIETNTTLIRAENPVTPIPWNTVTTSAFFVTTPGTYTVSVTNPNQPNGGSATVVGSFTVSQ
ncbi:MAG: hypothetical protein LAP21_27425, partial [Acidobacteriia bacterium]|nr:hypothetical protein [Terriglobia bacterium]